MGEFSKIAWTDHTWNPWWGCSRVSPGCENCYAERLATVRRKLPVWGVDAERKPMSEAYWREPLKWNRKALADGVRRRVFCASMADVFEMPPERNAQALGVMALARARLWKLIAETPALDWLLLTKRPQNVAALAPWGKAWPSNVWLGTTAEDQQRAAERIPKLLRIPAAVRFVSYEPALERVDFTSWLTEPGVCIPTTREGHAAFTRGLDWLIIGGESGPGARPFALEWAESAVEQTLGSTCAPFVKQLGARVVSEHRTVNEERLWVASQRDVIRPEDRAPNGEVWAWEAGLRDGKGGDPDEWPQELRVRRFPKPQPQAAA